MGNCVFFFRNFEDIILNKIAKNQNFCFKPYCLEPKPVQCSECALFTEYLPDKIIEQLILDILKGYTTLDKDYPHLEIQCKNFEEFQEKFLILSNRRNKKEFVEWSTVHPDKSNYIKILYLLQDDIYNFWWGQIINSEVWQKERDIHNSKIIFNGLIDGYSVGYFDGFGSIQNIKSTSSELTYYQKKMLYWDNFYSRMFQIYTPKKLFECDNPICEFKINDVIPYQENQTCYGCMKKYKLQEWLPLLKIEYEHKEKKIRIEETDLHNPSIFLYLDYQISLINIKKQNKKEENNGIQNRNHY